MAPVKKPSHAGKAVVAGGISGAVEICCTYPIEFTKTVLQLSTQKQTAMDVVKNTVRTRGVLGLYKGLDSMVYFATPKAAIRFSGFEAASNAMRAPDGSPMFGAATSFLAGLAAGAIEALFVTTPQETIKIKLIDDQFKTQEGGPRFKGFFHGVKTIVSEEGFAGIYHGLSPTILKVATAQATRFGVYMYIPADYRKTPLGSACSGAFAGGFSVIIFQGLDVIKSRMQGLDAAKYTSSIHCLKELIANEGIMALYKGVGPRMTRVCCEVAITMTLYGEVVKLLDSVWDTTKPPPRQLAHAGSTLIPVRYDTEVTKK